MTTSNSWYRSNLWRWKGNREYTKQGYEAAAVLFDATDLDVDCTGRHYMITGCNSGIGLEMAMEVARRGGEIHMVCRNPVAAKEARTNIITTTGNDKIHLHTLDLSRPRDVTRWARDFVASDNQLHVLINNAGCMVHERRIDEDGIETNFAVNTLAIHILTMTMLPLLQRSADARVVTVSSAGMLTVKLDPYDLSHVTLDPWNGALVYSQNKRQEIVMTLNYAMKYDKVHFSVMHPGWADTQAVRTSLPAFYEAMKDVLRTAGQGADTAVWLSLSKGALKHPSGLFFQDRVPVSPHLPLAWTRSSTQDEEVLMKALDEYFSKFTSELTPLTASPKSPTAKVFDDKSEKNLEENLQKIEDISSDVKNITLNVTDINENESTTKVVDDKFEKNLEEEKVKIENTNNVSEDVITKSEENHQIKEDTSNDVKNVELNVTALSETVSTTLKDTSSKLQDAESSLSNGVIPETSNELNDIKSPVEENLEIGLTKVEEKDDSITIEKKEEIVEVKESVNVEDLLNVNEPSSEVSSDMPSINVNSESTEVKESVNVEDLLNVNAPSSEVSSEIASIKVNPEYVEETI